MIFKLLTFASVLLIPIIHTGTGNHLFSKAPQESLPMANNPFLHHVQVLQEIKQKFSKEEKPTALPPTAKPKFTQTEAYLSVYKDDVNAKWNDALKTHEKLIDQVLTREKEFVCTHYSFYHAHDKQLMILHDFIKQLKSYMKLITFAQNFTIMRFKELQNTPHQSANRYLSKNSDINDHRSLTRSHMMSVNLSLFGNTFHSGECTFYYFLSNISQATTSFVLTNSLQDIFTYYKFDNKYIAALENLNKHLDSHTGALLQIFIPCDSVDKLAYLSHPMGKPYSSVIVAKYFDKSKERHTRISPILDLYCNNPSKLKKKCDMNELQARILFLNPMLEADSTYKIFRYTTIPEKNMTAYQQELNTIVQHIITDYLKANIQSDNTEPLVKLFSYIKNYKKKEHSDVA